MIQSCWLAALLVVAPLAAHAAAMGPDDARHLLNRAGFGAPPREIIEYARLSREDALDRLLAGALKVANTPPPEWIGDPIVPPRTLREATPEQRKELVAREIHRGVELRTWWLQEMLVTPSPLTERMTLFWHNHFVSSQQKVRYTQLMYRQNVLLRRHAVGNFGALLHAVAKDPAMVIYLDAATNRKGKPNENFAREVMELFTLGEGHYAESDIREAARAFTGWSIDRDTGAFKWRPVFHDDGTKTVFGKSGNFDGDAVLALLLEQPRTAEFITGKLWREFVSTEPDSAEVKRIARQFFASNYEIKVALREIFRSPAFWAAENRAALIKSPVDLVVGTMRALDFSVGDPLPLALLVAQLGQNLFAPPNVKGWPGGEAWINSSSLLARKNFAERLFRADEMPKIAMSELKRGGAGNEVAAAGKAGSIGAAGRERFVRALFEIQFDPDRWLSQFPGAVSRADIQRALLPREPVSEIALDSPTREFVKRIALDPAYQLK